jgi:hypothetical protein
MERQYYFLLNSIFHEVHGKNIDTETYNTLVKSLRVDRSPANVARIRESLISQKKDLDKSLVSPENRKISLLENHNIDCSNGGNGKSINLENKKILVISIIKNAERTFQYISNFLDDIAPFFERVCFYFLTNNNTDKTSAILDSYVKSNSCKNNVFGTFAKDFTYKNKVEYLAHLRNQCYQDACAFFNEDFDYLVVIDTNIASVLNVEGFIESFSLGCDWDIICGNRTFLRSPYHQDILSLRLLNEDLDITKQYKYIEKFYGESSYWIDKFYSFETWYKVQSAFGGILLCNKKVFKLKTLWNETPGKYESEHVSLCTKFANVYINPKLNHQSNCSIEGILYHEPYIFIPRDAGFFSVFNYLMGSITNGYRVYPFFNKNKCLEKNKFIKHFSYLDEATDNSWYHYFEPLTYHADDETHKSSAILLYNTTQGEDAPNEFKYPHETYKLFKHENFPVWRREVNKYYKKYIKPTSIILKRVDTIVSAFNNNPNVIAVLFRHPAHNCESTRTILFEDYFKKIDKILESYPDSLIYLTTDVDIAIGAFSSRYKDIVKYDIDSGRASYDNIIKWAIARGTGNIDDHGFVNNTGYEYHNECCKSGVDQVKHGQDIVTNVLVMASCKWFIYPQSNISLAISYINPEIEMIPVVD